MNPVRVACCLAAVVATWAADKIHDPGVLTGWDAPKFTYEEQD